MDTKSKALLGASVSQERKAQDIVILDLQPLTTFTDYFLICSGESSIQVKAIADGIMERLKKETLRAGHIEGYEGGRWVLLDYGDLVIHVFYRETREFYGLDKLWGERKESYGG